MIEQFYLILSVLYEYYIGIFGLKRKYESNKRLDGKVVVITGANTGIGKETAYQLSLRGAKIIIGCRDIQKGENAVKDIKLINPKTNITVLKLDLSSLTSVRQFVKSVEEQESKIDILINNAGVMMCPESQTEDGFEMQFGINHLGHFLLTLSLIPLLKKSSKARIITVSSMAHLFGEIHFENINLRNGAYTPLKAYNQSKLVNVLFTRELAKRLGPHSSITTYSLHPGAINSGLSRHFPLQRLINVITKLVFISVEMGAQTTLYCVLEESLENESGLYYDDCKRVNKMLSKATDERTAQKLWELSCDFVKLDNKLRI